MIIIKNFRDIEMLGEDLIKKLKENIIPVDFTKPRINYKDNFTFGLVPKGIKNPEEIQKSLPLREIKY